MSQEWGDIVIIRDGLVEICVTYVGNGRMGGADGLD